MSGDRRDVLKLPLDEDLSPWVAPRLQEAGVDAIPVRDRARLGATDGEVLAFAFAEDRILCLDPAR